MQLVWLMRKRRERKRRVRWETLQEANERGTCLPLDPDVAPRTAPHSVPHMALALVSDPGQADTHLPSPPLPLDASTGTPLFPSPFAVVRRVPEPAPLF